jgi:hypothetical protein
MFPPAVDRERLGYSDNGCFIIQRRADGEAMLETSSATSSPALLYEHWRTSGGSLMPNVLLRADVTM